MSDSTKDSGKNIWWSWFKRNWWIIVIIIIIIFLIRFQSCNTSDSNKKMKIPIITKQEEPTKANRKITIITTKKYPNGHDSVSVQMAETINDTLIQEIYVSPSE